MEKPNSRFETALITGASSGIGLELARLFAKDGYNLLLVAREKKPLTDIAIQIRSDYKVSVGVIAHDLSQENAGTTLYNLIKKNNQKVSILVNNAGFGGYGAHVDRKVEEEHKMVNCNVTCLMDLTRLFASDMKAGDGGKILNVASIAGFLPGPYQSVYYATKAFVVSYTLAIANELKGSNVIISCLCPGPTATKFAERAGLGTDHKLFKGAMDAETVAHAGYDGLMRNKTLVIPGFQNKIMIFLSRFASRKLVAEMVAKRHLGRMKQ